VKGLKGFAWIAGAAVLAVVLAAFLYIGCGWWNGREQADAGRSEGDVACDAPLRERGAIAEVDPDIEGGGGDGIKAEDESDETMTDEERAEAEEERLVEGFDALTDKWQEPSAKDVTVDDVNAFVTQFAKVPKGRKEECLQRALNLIPDENVMLLVGVLMDRRQDKELVELVFNDILNREESVKVPILQQVFKDKAHPCWADAAWILDMPVEAQAAQ